MLIALLMIERDMVLEELAAIEAGEKSVSFADHQKLLVRLEALNRTIAELQQGEA